MMTSLNNSAREEFNIKYLNQFVGREIEFKLKTGEHLIGILASNNQHTGVFHFVNVKKNDGEAYAIRQSYVYSDFLGNFICEGGIVLPKVDVAQAENNLKNIIEDVNRIIVPISGDVEDEIDPDDVIVVPARKDNEYESLEFDFVLNQEDFESPISNEVTCIGSIKDPDFSTSIDILERQSIVGLSILPMADDRTAIIEVVIFGCEEGTFIFPIVSGVMEKLKNILESESICKVMHDSCLASARLYSVYKIDLTNVEDTLVLDSVLVTQNVKPNKRMMDRSYEFCVSSYLEIQIPWSTYSNFYSRCGKGKLLDKSLDDTGRGYARSLVMLLPELRLEMLKHIFYPTLVKQVSYLNCVKYASAHEYASLKTHDLITPYHLKDAELVAPESVSFESVSVVSEIMKKKFKFFNKVMTKKQLKSVYCQVNFDNAESGSWTNSYPHVNMPCSTRTYFDQRLNQTVTPRGSISSSNSEIMSLDINDQNGHIYSSSQLSSESPSSSGSPEKVSKPMQQNSDSSFNCNGHSSLRNGNGSHLNGSNHNGRKYKLADLIKKLPAYTNRLKLTDGDSIDWPTVSQEANDRPGTTKIYPAGCNF